MELEPFHPRFPWYGRHLQSMRNPLRPAPVLAGGEGARVLLPLGDGDVLMARRDDPEARRKGRPVVVLIHGLGGCETSNYILAASAFFTTLGSTVFRLNLRGAGPSQASCRDWSHAGRYADLEIALPQLDTRGPLVVIGFSLGGCVLLNYLARGSVDPRLAAAASVSAPLDLSAASDVLHTPRNRLYHAYLLRALRASYLNPHAQLTADERNAIVTAPDLFAVDDRFTAPRHGFAGADAYYAFASPSAHLKQIRLPTLLIHAVDDPFVPAEPYAGVAASNVDVAVARGGGHLGFHDKERLWHLRRIEVFLAAAGITEHARALSEQALPCS